MIACRKSVRPQQDAALDFLAKAVLADLRVLLVPVALVVGCRAVSDAVEPGEVRGGFAHRDDVVGFDGVFDRRKVDLVVARTLGFQVVDRVPERLDDALVGPVEQFRRNADFQALDVAVRGIGKGVRTHVIGFGTADLAPRVPRGGVVLVGGGDDFE